MTDLQRQRAFKIAWQLKAFHSGRGNAINAKKLVESLDMNFPSATRRLREIISALRKDGAPICSTYQGGYYWASTLEEKVESDAQKRKHGISELAIAKAERLKTDPGQLALFGGGR